MPESLGRMTKPSSTVKAKPAQAIAACRNFLASSRYGMKISGTSLIPAATPVPNPFHQRLLPVFGWVSGWHRSQMISAIRTRLTWPRYMVRRTGSVQKTAAAPSRVAPSLVSVLAVAEAAEGQPERDQQRDDVHRHRQLLGQPPRDERDDREGNGRERRVGERQVQLAVTDPVIERRRQARVVQRPDVPDDKPARPVNGQVHRVHGEALGVDDRVDHVEPEGHGERAQAGQEQPAAWPCLVPGGRPRAGEDRSHLANPSGSGLGFRSRRCGCLTLKRPPGWPFLIT